MKLNKNFIRHTMDGQAIVVPTGDADFHGLVQGNKTVGAILECLENDTTEEKIVETMCARFNGDRRIIEEDVADVIAQLRRIGAVDE